MTAPATLPFARVELLPGARRLVELHAAELPQKDDLCGAFCATVALRAIGVRDAGGRELEQDDLAVRAGSAVFSGDHAASLPPREGGRRDYALDIPVIDDEPRSGTSAAGLARAIEAFARRRLRVVPATGEWSRDRLSALLGVVRSLESPCPIVANVATTFFWDSRAPLSTLLRYLDDGDPDAGPPSEWCVGHFVLVVGTVEGKQGSLAIVADTYGSLGASGVHLQPLERVALALRRPGLAEGGILLLCDAADAGQVERAVTQAGLSSRLWDNGSVDMLAAA
jgi:Family of unknown function (DUF6885)